MEDYQIKAIRNGGAMDCKSNPEQTEKYIRERIGWMSEFSNIEEVIQVFKNTFKSQGVVFFGDADMHLIKWQLKVLPKYLEIIINNFKKELKNEKN